MRPGTFLTLNISGWQIAHPNYAEAEVTLALAVSSEGVLSCGGPTWSGGSRSFSGGDAPCGLCISRPLMQFLRRELREEVSLSGLKRKASL
jgi:hypothetical protein